MIKIIKDNNILEVTKGAYNELFKPLGYTNISKVEDKGNKESKDYDKNSKIKDKENYPKTGRK